MKKRKHDQKTDVNFLPSHIGESFLRELSALIADLSSEGGFKEKYLASEFLSKFCDPSTTPPEVRRSSAIKKWLSVEKRNQRTNARIMLGEEDFGYATSDDIILDARRIVAKTLGTVNVDRIFANPSHTNGASTRIRRSPKALIEKHEGKAHLSSSSIRWWLSVASSTRLATQPLELYEASELFTVPKSTDIDRVACKEPEINMLLQRCVGGYIRRRLAVAGINLNDQTTNQILAREALDRGLATIDLSSASDSISKSLVMALLPTEWWVLLDDLRVHYASVDGDIHHLQMFSSMGNGFTFELESLLFWALTRSICKNSGVKGRISVYGDDIIAPSKIGPRLKRTFSWFGFTVNEKKSHWSGQFRESCGKHYHGKTDVTPFYVRKPISQKSEMIRLLNRLLIWDGSTYKCFITEKVALFHAKWSKQIPTKLWGGTNPEDIMSLVSGDAPRKRLLQKRRPLAYNDTYALESWFLMTFDANQKPGWSWKSTSLPIARESLVGYLRSMEDAHETSPSVVGRCEYGNPEPFRDRNSNVYDAGEVTKWDPYLIFGSTSVQHTQTNDSFNMFIEEDKQLSLPF